MTYESDSGTPSPEGTDAFAPTAQLKDLVDAESQWNYVIGKADATARNAMSAPELRDNILVSQESDDSLWLCTDASGPTWVRVYAPHNRQLDTTNSTIDSFMQSGIGKITGSATTTITETVTFPVAFSAQPVVVMSYMGSRTAGAFNPVGLNNTAGPAANAQIATTTNFLAAMTLGSNFGTSDYYYSWIAIGAR